ncbi:MAG: hypothetical protein JRI54_14165, partial [Deltaproteobacteria bacterium]|nr:hypothetical protein [Deltaproteobacteria bacterium]
MARKKSSEDPSAKVNPLGWMVTFSDLITLLLTFFVLLITMSSMDVKTVRQAFEAFTGGSGPFEFGKKGKMEDLAQIISLINRASPQTLLENINIKEVIFKFDEAGYQRLMKLLEKDIKVRVTEKGLAI